MYSVKTGVISVHRFVCLNLEALVFVKASKLGTLKQLGLLIYAL